MVLTDTHCHLYDEAFDTDRVEMVERAIQSGVKRFFLPNVDTSTIQPLDKLVKLFPTHCFGMMGLHPCSVKTDFSEELRAVKEELYNGNYVGVGEIGIDLYWDKSTFKEQLLVFNTQCQWARELNLPVIIHSRDSTSEVIEALKGLKDRVPKGIFHCFSGTKDEALEIIKLGFYLGIGGVVTYKNSDLPQILSGLSPDHLVLETDSPYLAPVPYRGKRNESGYLVYVAEKLAGIYGVTIEAIAEITTENSMKIFSV